MKKSAGLLMYRVREGRVELLLAHPGGPYWARRDEGAWTLPKGEYTHDEEALAAARREFAEETGLEPSPPFAWLGEVRLKNGKRISAWAFEGDCDPGQVRSNLFEMEWPPRSGRQVTFPEIDRVGWFTPDEARRKLHPAQAAFAERLAEALSAPAKD